MVDLAFQLVAGDVDGFLWIPLEHEEMGAVAFGAFFGFVGEGSNMPEDAALLGWGEHRAISGLGA